MGRVGGDKSICSGKGQRFPSLYLGSPVPNVSYSWHDDFLMICARRLLGTAYGSCSCLCISRLPRPSSWGFGACRTVQFCVIEIIISPWVPDHVDRIAAIQPWTTGLQGLELGPDWKELESRWGAATAQRYLLFSNSLFDTEYLSWPPLFPRNSTDMSGRWSFFQ